MKRILILLLIAFTIFNQDIFSCQCKSYSLDSLQKLSYEESDIVFLGELVSSNLENATYKFKIYETFKGNDSLTFIYGQTFTSCSMLPSEKSLWIVYANFLKGDTIDINGCLASRSFEKPELSVHIPKPPPSEMDYNSSVEYEIEMLKANLQREKLRRQALTDLIIEIEKLRYKKRTVNR